MAILAIVEAGNATLISSNALEYEIKRIPNSNRRSEAQAILKAANEFVAVNQQIIQLAQTFNNLKIHPLDALHLACAEYTKADFFSSTDDRFLKNAQAIPWLSCKVITVLDLLMEVSK